MQAEGLPTNSTDLAGSMTVEPVLPPHQYVHKDDEPVLSDTDLLPKELQGVPAPYIVKLPTFSPSTYGLILLASRQTKWSASLSPDIIPADLPEDLRQALLLQIPTVTRTNADITQKAKDTCIIASNTFKDRTPIWCLNYFRAAAIQTLHKYLMEVEYMPQNLSATRLDHLSQSTQALLQALDAVQSASTWTAASKPNSVEFLPVEIQHNPLRQQAQQFVLLLQDPLAVNDTVKFTIKPPRIRKHHRGDEDWNPWWRTAILLQSPDTLPMPSTSSTGQATGYLHLAIAAALQASEALLYSIKSLTPTFASTSHDLRQAPDGSYVISHVKKDTST